MSEKFQTIRLSDPNQVVTVEFEDWGEWGENGRAALGYAQPGWTTVFKFDGKTLVSVMPLGDYPDLGLARERHDRKFLAEHDLDLNVMVFPGDGELLEEMGGIAYWHKPALAMWQSAEDYKRICVDASMARDMCEWEMGAVWPKDVAG